MNARIPSLPWATLTIPPAGRLNGVSSKAEARQLSAAGSRSVVPLTYGKDRIGGLLLNVLPASADSATILVQVLWGFAGTAIEDLLLNGLALPTDATVTSYFGAQTTPDAALVSAFAAQSITYEDSLQGYAYSVLALPQSVIGTELQVTGLFSGRKLYDPRKDSTAGGSGAHRLNDPSTWEWSDSPALALGDFLANALYGAAETVNWATVATAANANDATVGSPAEKRRLLGVTFMQPASVGDVAEALRAYAGCFLLPGEAGIKLLPDAVGSAVASYNHADGAIASIAPLQLRDLGNSPTVVEVIYTDTTVVPWRDASAFAELPGAGTTLPYRLSQVRLPGVQRYSQARREAIERLNKLTLQDLSTTIEVFDIGIRHERGDIVSVSHPIGITNKLFRVTDLESPRPGVWTLPLIEYDPACYSDVVETVPTYANSGALISETGGAGAGGLSSYMIEIYTQAPTQPATPQGGQYTFTGDVFVPPVSGAGSGGDPLWADVLLRLDTQGTVGATTLTDQGPAGLGTLTFTSGASIATTRGRWSDRSLRLTEAGPVANYWESAQLNRPAGTAMSFEFWVYNAITPNADPGAPFFEWRTPSNVRIFMLAAFANAGRIYAYNGAVATDLGVFTRTAWMWVQVVVDTDNTVRVRIDNTQVFSAAFADHSTAGLYRLRFGAFEGVRSDFADVTIDDIRVTKAVRPWAVPTERLPLSGPPLEYWSRDQPPGGLEPTWASRYLVQTTTPDVPIDIPLSDSWAVPNKHVQDGEDGEGGPVLYLTATSQTFTFDGAGVPLPTSQTITFEAIESTLTGVAVFTATRFDAAGSSLGAATLGGSGMSRTLTVADFGAAQRCVVTVTMDGYSDTITVVRVANGADGAPGGAAIVASLDTYFVAFAADGAGIVTAGQSFDVTMQVLVNGADDTSAWTISRASSDASITTTLTGATVSITGMGTGLDTGSVAITATKVGSPTQTLICTVGKLKAGSLPGLQPNMNGLQAYNFSDVGTASASLTFDAEGRVRDHTSAYLSPWHLPAGAGVIGGDFWIRATQLTGPAVTGPLGSWVSLATERTYLLERTTAGINEATLEFEIASNATGAGFVGRGTMTITAERG